MTRGRKTPVEIKAEIIKQRLQGRNIEEIEASTGIANQTISDITNKEIGKLREYTPIIAKIIENDMQSILDTTGINTEYIKQVKSKGLDLDRSEVDTINKIIEGAFKRSQIYQNRASEKIDMGKTDISNLSTDELIALREQLKKTLSSIT